MRSGRRAFLYGLRKGATRLGLDIRPYSRSDSPHGRVARLLTRCDVDLVLDVGANIGQYSRGLREGGYAGRICSFEPLSEPFRHLDAASRDDLGWTAVRSAIGSEVGEARVNISANHVSSSVLPVLDVHVAAAPESRVIGAEIAPMTTVDEYLSGVGSSRPFLKIDTQGYESAVLDGAQAGLALMAGVQVEMSLTPLYEGQELFDDLFHRLTSSGFALWDLQPGFRDPASGRLLQVDAVFIRDDVDAG